jgi:DNA-binding MarR family transcriptional regulator
VELDLLERREDPSDRRHVVVTPTPQAEEMVDHFRELNSNRMREMLIHLDRADLDTVERSLHILTAALEARATTSIDHTGVEDVGRSVTNAVGDRS